MRLRLKLLDLTKSAHLKPRTVLSALASFALLTGVALPQTAPAQSPASGQDKPTDPAHAGGTMGGNEGGQNLPAGTAPNPSQGTTGNTADQPPSSGLQTKIKSGGQGGAMEGGNLPAGAVSQQATKHIAVVNAALVTGATNANMLKQIAADPASYDADHGQMFVANIKQAVAQAGADLAQLRPLAHGKATSQVEDVQTRLDKVKDMLPKIEQDLTNAKTVGSYASQCASQLRGGRAVLKNVSSTMHTKMTLGPTG